jgi:hypothetical protein
MTGIDDDTPGDPAGPEASFGALVEAVRRGPDDPSRGRLERRGRNDPALARELELAHRLDALLETAVSARSAEDEAADVRWSSELEGRLLRRLGPEIDADRAPAGPTGLGLVGWLPLLAAAGLWGLLGERVLARGVPPARFLETAGLAAIGAAAMLVALVVARGRVSRFALAGVVAGSALYAALVGVLRDGAAGPLSLAGAKCALIELAGGLLPLAVLAGLLARRGFGPGSARLATVAGAGALGAQAVVELGCPAAGPAHLWAFHVGGVLVAVGFGSVAARWLRPFGNGAGAPSGTIR